MQRHKMSKPSRAISDHPEALGIVWKPCSKQCSKPSAYSNLEDSDSDAETEEKEKISWAEAAQSLN